MFSVSYFLFSIHLAIQEDQWGDFEDLPPSHHHRHKHNPCYYSPVYIVAVATFIITVTTRIVTNADVAVDLQGTFVNVTWCCYSFHKTETIHGCKSFTLHFTNHYVSHNNRVGNEGEGYFLLRHCHDNNLE